MASTVAETLITEMQLDDSKYRAGAQRIIAINQQLIASFQGVAAANGAANFGSNNSYTINNIGGPGGGSGSGGGGGMGSMFGFYLALRAVREVEHAFVEMDEKLIHFSSDALQQFAVFDTLQKSFEGIYGSSEKAAQMLNYLQSISETSAFQFHDLADAARGLSVAGLDVGRFLPIVQGFALAMGHIDGGGLEDFTRILREIRGGNTGLALGPRGIGRYGVGREELEQHGATFDAHGHFTGSVNQAFDAVESVFNDRIKGIADSAKKSFEVVLSDFRQALQQDTTQFGAGLAENLTKPLSALTDALNDLRESGVLKLLGETVSGLVTSALPFAAYGKTGGKNPFQLTGTEGGAQFAHSTGNAVEDVLVNIGADIVKLVSYTVDTVTILTEIYDFFNRFAPAPIPDSIAGRADRAAAKFRQEAYNAAYLNSQKAPAGAPTAPTGNAIPGLDDDDPINKTLKGIRRHTEKMASKMDERATAFGGGDIGRLGVTPVEMGQYYNNAVTAHGIAGKMSAMGSAIEGDIQRMINDILRHYMKQNMLSNATG